MSKEVLEKLYRQHNAKKLNLRPGTFLNVFRPAPGTSMERKEMVVVADVQDAFITVVPSNEGYDYAIIPLEARVLVIASDGMLHQLSNFNRWEFVKVS
jgi:selenophosphate synthetase-related protein